MLVTTFEVSKNNVAAMGFKSSYKSLKTQMKSQGFIKLEYNLHYAIIHKFSLLIPIHCLLCFFINFSDEVAPLTSLASPKSTFHWIEKCQFAFETTKALLCKTPVLAARDLRVLLSWRWMPVCLPQGECIERPIYNVPKKQRRHQYQ